tara:strand:+ start:766 stop:1233 length:468 start_codon:yes stop_codon:yes gene_type:complete
VLKNFYPITPEAAFSVASNLLPADRRECVEGYGYESIVDIAIGALIPPKSVYYKAPNGKTAAIGGVQEDGKIWMLSTPSVKDYPIQYARDIFRFVSSRPDKLLWNIVDKRNTTHIKLLRFLGFTFLREITFGPNNLPFIEFCKINYGSRNRNATT